MLKPVNPPNYISSIVYPFSRRVLQYAHIHGTVNIGQYIGPGIVDTLKLIYKKIKFIKLGRDTLISRFDRRR